MSPKPKRRGKRKRLMNQEKAKSAVTPSKKRTSKKPKKKAEASRKRPEEVPTLILAGFHGNTNKLATLEEVRNPDSWTRTIGELSHRELVRLICARVELESNFVPLHMLGVDGILDKTRALREIRSGSHIGLHLLDIEKEFLSLQLRRTR